jgi:multidrug efflux pump subunit AcrB
MLWLWNFFLEKRQFSYVLIVTLVLAGTYALLGIPKENNPQIIIPDGVVVAALPGASASDMETLVTNKLEDQISGISNIDTMTSSSGDGISQIIVQFDASADIDQSIQDLRDAVAKAIPDLPSDATTPVVSKINLSDQPILVVSISGDLPATEFSALGQSVSDDLKGVAGVSKVAIAGVPPREVDVVVSKEKLQQYGLRLTDIVGAIGASNAALPAGNISMQGVNYDVNFKGGITDPEEIETIAVGAKNGSPIYLRDIALISNGLAAPSTYSRLSLGGKPSDQAITLTIYKQSSASIQGVADAVRAKLADLEASKLLHMNVFVAPSTDAGKQVGKQLGELATTGVVTVLLVIGTLLLTIGWRESLVAALSIPMSFLIAFLGLYLTGNTLNFISLFALILAVGILVDSGIVVTEAIHARMRIHGDPVRAAHAALADYAWPLIAGTMATVAVFAPLFFLSGIIGKYIAGIPYTLVFVLIASIFVALGQVPLIAILLTKAHEKSRLELLQEEYTDRVTAWYRAKLRALLLNQRLQKRFIWGLTAAFIVALILPFSGVLSVLFLPQDNQDFVLVSIEKPRGTTLAQTDLAAREVEELLYQDPNIASFQTTVGEGSALQNGSGASGSNIANITVNLPEGHALTSTEMVNELSARLAPITDANVQVLQSSNGPPGGAPIQVRFTGENLDDLVVAADAGKQLLASMPHVKDITSSTKNNGTEFDLAIDRAKAAAYGVTTAQVAQTLRAAINGVKATSITEPDQNIEVHVKLNLNAAYTDPSNTADTTLDSIKNLTIQGTSGPVLLGSILTDSIGPSNASIAHKDKLRVETVSAYTDDKITAADAVSAFQSRIGELRLPSGVTVAYGGEQQDIDQSFAQMFIALIAGLVLMFMILIVSFNSFRFTGQLLLIVPLSLIGVLGGLALTGQPISFSSLLGVIALGGIIINHAIILMDSMLHHLKAEPGKPLIDTVVDSAATRLRPIVLTTIATVIGMVPLSLSNPTWGPLAFSIMFGLTFAIILTLALVPVLFYRAPHPELGLPKISKRV